MFDEFDSPLARQLEALRLRRKKLKTATMPAPAETRIIAVSNQKGGVGKTTSTVNLAAAFALNGMRVLVIDIDPQGNASSALGVNTNSDVPGTYETILKDLPMAEAIVRSTSIENLYCCPATLALASAEIELFPLDDGQTRLRKSLYEFLNISAKNGHGFDYVLIDCPPSLSMLTMNAFSAAKEILVPMQTEYYALEGLEQLVRSIYAFSSRLTHPPKLSTILLTMFDKRLNLAQDVVEDVRTHFPKETLETTIPRSVRISEAPSFQQTIMTYDPNGVGAVAYREAALEIARRGA